MSGFLHKHAILFVILVLFSHIRHHTFIPY